VQIASVAAHDVGAQICAGVVASVDASTTSELPQAPALVTTPALLLSTRKLVVSTIGCVTVWHPGVAVSVASTFVHELKPESPTKSCTVLAVHVPFVVIAHRQVHAASPIVGSATTDCAVVPFGHVVGSVVANVTIALKPAGSAMPQPASHARPASEPPASNEASASTCNPSRPDTSPHPMTTSDASVRRMGRRNIGKIPQPVVQSRQTGDEKRHANDDDRSAREGESARRELSATRDPCERDGEWDHDGELTELDADVEAEERFGDFSA